ncbi:hypothetical protein VNO77_42195 [Canavalia gladiata]|uniref:Uncharacterized protein n=1 Tax=Canavalia gladiata TaxID=3824 RepID=A0AAN9K223_CANGL
MKKRRMQEERFRLRDISEYEEWYGQPYRAPDLQRLREEIKNASLVANPGCYPTSIQLPLVPLIKFMACLRELVSWIWRSAKENLLLTEVTEGLNSYDVTRHCHVMENKGVSFIVIEVGNNTVTTKAQTNNTCGAIGAPSVGTSTSRRAKIPEIEQGLAAAQSRGMQSTIFVEMAPGVRIEDVYQHMKLSYEVMKNLFWYWKMESFLELIVLKELITV